MPNEAAGSINAFKFRYSQACSGFTGAHALTGLFWELSRHSDTFAAVVLEAKCHPSYSSFPPLCTPELLLPCNSAPPHLPNGLL